MNEIDLRHLRYFLAVAENLHFTRAAEQLGLAQPALSQQIRRLEGLIGHVLLIRSTRGVKLTHAGEALAERARNTLARVANDIDLVRRVGRGEKGSLRLGFSGSVMFTEMPASLRRFRERYPDIELQLHEMWTSAQMEALRDGALDIAFLRDGDTTDGVLPVTLIREPYIAVLPADHRLAKKRSFALADLRLEPFVLFPRHMGPLAYDRTIACCEGAGFRPDVVQYSPQFPTLFRLVAAGIGVSLAPACMAQITVPGAVYRKVSGGFTTVDVARRTGLVDVVADNFLRIVREVNHS
jgi:DNA-binding transcriptional LysR family regulator